MCISFQDEDMPLHTSSLYSEVRWWVLYARTICTLLSQTKQQHFPFHKQKGTAK